MRKWHYISIYIFALLSILNISLSPTAPIIGSLSVARATPTGPSTPEIKTISHLPGTTFAVTGDGQHIIAARYQYPQPPNSPRPIMELAALDTFNPAFPKLVDTYSFGESGTAILYPTGIFMDNHLVYLPYVQSVPKCCINGYMGIWDASLQQPIHQVGNISLPPPNDVSVNNGFAYIPTQDNNQRNALVIVDVTDPTSPTIKTSIDEGGAYVPKIYLDDTHLYIVDPSGLEIEDVSVPDQPNTLGHLNTEYPTDIVVSNQLAYIADLVNGLKIADVSNPISPTLLNALNIPGGVDYINEQDGFVYLGLHNGGMDIADVHDPIHPVIAASAPITSTLFDIYLSGNYIYAGGNDGLWTFWYAPTKSAVIPNTGGSFVVQSENLTYSFASGVFSSTTVISHTAFQQSDVPPLGPLVGLGRFYRNEGAQAGATPIVDLAKPYTMTISYDAAMLGPMIENTMAFYYWDGSQWVREPTSTLDTANHTLSATPNHFSLWAVLGEARHAYFPILERMTP